MRFYVITLFPEMIEQAVSFGILGRAVNQGKLEVSCINPRDYATDRHRTVDDRPYGGGPGMLMKVQPVADAIEAVRKDAGDNAKVIYLSPRGKRLQQRTVRSVAEQGEAGQVYILLAGRYEGIEERLISSYVDEEWSIGDYVLSGGELPAMVIMDAVARLLPGVLGDDESALQDSFMDGLLDFPHFTRPDEINGQTVPEVLLGGDHAAIKRWRSKQALGMTWLHRPDLLEEMDLNEEQRQLLAEFQSEQLAAKKNG